MTLLEEAKRATNIKCNTKFGAEDVELAVAYYRNIIFPVQIAKAKGFKKTSYMTSVYAYVARALKYGIQQGMIEIKEKSNGTYS